MRKNINEENSTEEWWEALQKRDFAKLSFMLEINGNLTNLHPQRSEMQYYSGKKKFLKSLTAIIVLLDTMSNPASDEEIKILQLLLQYEEYREYSPPQYSVENELNEAIAAGKFVPESIYDHSVIEQWQTAIINQDFEESSRLLSNFPGIYAVRMENFNPDTGERRPRGYHTGIYILEHLGNPVHLNTIKLLNLLIDRNYPKFNNEISFQSELFDAIQSGKVPINLLENIDPYAFVKSKSISLNRLEQFGIHLMTQKELKDFMHRFKEYIINLAMENNSGDPLEFKDGIMRIREFQKLINNIRDYLESELKFKKIDEAGQLDEIFYLSDKPFVYSGEILKKLNLTSENIKEILKNRIIFCLNNNVILKDKNIYKIEDYEYIIYSSEDFYDLNSKLNNKNRITSNTNDFGFNAFKYYGNDPRAFIVENALKSPSMALIMDFYKRKGFEDDVKVDFKDIYITNSPFKLREMIDLCYDLDNENSVKIIFQGNGDSLKRRQKFEDFCDSMYLYNAAHFNLLLLEKKDGIYYIILLDSLGEKSIYKARILNLIAETLTAEQKENTVFCFNRNVRQNDPSSCVIFTAKDCKNIEKSADFVVEICENKCKPTPGEKHGLKTMEFTLPARFMGLTQSRTTLQTYEDNHPELVRENLKNKNIMQYAFKERNKLNLPATPLNESGKVLNNSALYFRAKYEYQINKLRSECSLQELQSKMDHFDLEANIDKIESLCSDCEVNSAFKP